MKTVIAVRTLNKLRIQDEELCTCGLGALSKRAQKILGWFTASVLKIRRHECQRVEDDTPKLYFIWNASGVCEMTARDISWT
jgi:hypothetical protein